MTFDKGDLVRDKYTGCESRIASVEVVFALDEPFEVYTMEPPFPYSRLVADDSRMGYELRLVSKGFGVKH